MNPSPKIDTKPIDIQISYPRYGASAEVDSISIIETSDNVGGKNQEYYIYFNEREPETLSNPGFIAGKWNGPNNKQTSRVGFDVLPGGRASRYNKEVNFVDEGLKAFFWTNHSDSFGTAYFVGFYYFNTSLIDLDYYYSNNGMSVRCVKDGKFN